MTSKHVSAASDSRPVATLSTTRSVRTASKGKSSEKTSTNSSKPMIIFGRLLQHSQSNKTVAELPPGVSGPIVRYPKRGRPTACLLVHVPLPGGKWKNSSVYIGTDQTYTEEKFKAAVEKAKKLRGILTC